MSRILDWLFRPIRFNPLKKEQDSMNSEHRTLNERKYNASNWRDSFCEGLDVFIKVLGETDSFTIEEILATALREVKTSDLSDSRLFSHIKKLWKYVISNRLFHLDPDEYLVCDQGDGNEMYFYISGGPCSECGRGEIRPHWTLDEANAIAGINPKVAE